MLDSGHIVHLHKRTNHGRIRETEWLHINRSPIITIIATTLHVIFLLVQICVKEWGVELNGYVHPITRSHPSSLLAETKHQLFVTY